MQGRTMKNGTMFDCFTAKILAELYNEFPIKIDYNMKDFDKDACMDKEKKIYKVQEETVEEVLCYTFIFLEENGIISTGDESEHSMCFFPETGLTLKGLKLLNKEPSSIKPDISIGDKLVDALRTKGTESAAKLIEKTLWGLLS